MTARRRFIGIACFGMLVALGAEGRVHAQQTPDPYSPWNSMYRPFVFPNTYYNPALPNQARMGYLAEGRTTRSDYFDSLNGFDPGIFESRGRVSGRGVPYYRSFQSQRSAAADEADLRRERTYVPNAGDTFFQEQAARQETFFNALRERDPRRRAEMLQKVESSRLQAARAAGRAPAPPPGSTTRGGTTIPGTGRAGLRDGEQADQDDSSGSGTRTRTNQGLDLLRPLSPFPAPTRPNLDSREDDRPPSRPGSSEPQLRYAVPPNIENLLDGPAGGGRNLPSAPEPR